MAKLATVVHVMDDKGVNHVFGPADEVPVWAASRITNPKAWAEAPETPRESTSAAPPAKKAPAKRAPARRKAADSDSVHG